MCDLVLGASCLHITYMRDVDLAGISYIILQMNLPRQVLATTTTKLCNSTFLFDLDNSKLNLFTYLFTYLLDLS